MSLRWDSTVVTRAQAARHVHPDAAFRRGRRMAVRRPSRVEVVARVIGLSVYLGGFLALALGLLWLTALGGR